MINPTFRKCLVKQINNRLIISTSSGRFLYVRNTPIKRLRNVFCMGSTKILLNFGVCCTTRFFITCIWTYRSSHRDYFRKYLFSSRSTFFWIFLGGFMCSPNRCKFSRKVCLFAEQIQIFQDLSLCVHRTDINSGRFVCSPNRYRFSRIPLYVFTEQIQIFQDPSLCVHRTDINFPEQLFSYRTDTDFPRALLFCYQLG